MTPDLKDIKAGRFDGMLEIRISTEKEALQLVRKITEIPEIESVEFVHDAQQGKDPAITPAKDQKKKRSADISCLGTGIPAHSG